MKVGDLVRDTRGDFDRPGVVLSITDSWCKVVFDFGWVYVREEFLEVISECR